MMTVASRYFSAAFAALEKLERRSAICFLSAHGSGGINFAMPETMLKLSCSVDGNAVAGQAQQDGAIMVTAQDAAPCSR